MKTIKLLDTNTQEFKQLDKKHYGGKLKERVADGDVTISCPTFDDVDTIIIFDSKSKDNLEDFGATVTGDTVTIVADAKTQKQVATGIALGYNNVGLYKTNKETQAPVIKNNKGETIASAEFVAGVQLARELANQPGNKLTPKVYNNRIHAEFAQFYKTVQVKTLDKHSLSDMGFNTLLSVAQGSANEPFVVIIEYRGNPDSSDFDMAYVGKGVTFDSGGISLKPGAKMHEMKLDMGGSAAVVGAMYNLANTAVKANVVGIVGLVENMPSGTASRPGDVVTTLSGQTVENQNTDAEGRLVLCDLLTHIQNEYPTVNKIVDLATLTGAIIVALGTEYAGLFSNSTDFSNRIVDSSEQFWRMPLNESYAKQLKSDIADMTNIGGNPGSATAAEFLYKFVDKKIAWAHLDIAGTGMVDGKGTGFGVRTLTELAVDADKIYTIDKGMDY